MRCDVPADRRSSDSGFTLVELLVGIVIMGILAGLGTAGWMSYHRSVEHRNSAQALVSALRNAQQASLAEAVTYCVELDSAARSYTIYKFGCAPGGPTSRVLVKPATKTASERVKLVTPAFLQSDGSMASKISFFPRGSASKGNVKVSRDGSAKAYTISVEGLTGRVSLAG